MSRASNWAETLRWNSAGCGAREGDQAACHDGPDGPEEVACQDEGEDDGRHRDGTASNAEATGHRALPAEKVRRGADASWDGHEGATSEASPVAVEFPLYLQYCRFSEAKSSLLCSFSIDERCDASFFLACFLFSTRTAQQEMPVQMKRPFLRIGQRWRDESFTRPNKFGKRFDSKKLPTLDLDKRALGLVALEKST